MERPGIRELVGRAMIDRDFFAALLRDTAAVLAGYDLAADERAAVLQAVARASSSPEGDRRRAFQSVVIKRWAT